MLCWEKIIIITHGLSNTQFFIKIFKELIDEKTINHLKAVQRYMSILPIAAPHMEEFIKEAATKRRLFWIREHYLAKFHGSSHNGCFQDHGHKWIKWDN